MTVEEVIAKKPNGLGIRHLQVIMMFLALLLAFSMRVNLSMGIVAMTDPDGENTFDWSLSIQSMILSSFFWGYIVLQIPGGVLASRFGGKILILICIGVNSLITLLIPTAARLGDWQMVCACRVLQGLSQGFIYPSLHTLVAKWVPLEEKGRLGTVVYVGGQLGTAFQHIAAGFIADLWGWPAIFYVTGTIGAIWTIVYIIIGSSSPQESRFITSEERLYIQTSLGQIGGHKRYKTPWKAIFTSMPFISLIIAHCGQNWGHWTLITEIPSYMSKVLGVDIKHNGIISALPYLALFVLSIPNGFVADYILKKKWLSITASRKLFNSIGAYGPAIALICLSYTPADVVIATSLLVVVVGINAGHFAGYILVHIDMAPNFAGQMMGITNFFANIISLITPLAAGAILQDESDPSEWRKVFYVSAGVYILCNTIFVIFATSEKQPWNEVEENIRSQK
ncbi:putative inorganic phosphate cotransporter isoform X2 [Galleria mellonella]|uniref:Inorganic phosphate cotransporter isoform X2 n=1 Tax=Galleria mellonella TaxID=7137 RepID=A0ABM3M8F2_GALME|nr:putative inorganic phosphate cotransporter isoform X2 [Galleria mellonella]